jgi:hypothetical protein
MKEQKFTLNLEGKNFDFEIDSDGYVWIVEKNEKFQMPEKTNIGQLRPVYNIEEAKEVGKVMLYISRRIQKIEHQI